MFDDVLSQLGPGVGPLPHLEYSGKGYGVEGVKFKAGKQGHCCSTFSKNSLNHVKGSQAWIPRLGPVCFVLIDRVVFTFYYCCFKGKKKNKKKTEQRFDRYGTAQPVSHPQLPIVAALMFLLLYALPTEVGFVVTPCTGWEEERLHFRKN